MEKLVKRIKEKRILIWDLDGTIVDLDIDWQGLRQELVGKKTGEEKLAAMFRHENSCPFATKEMVVKFIKNICQKYQMALFSDNLHSTIERVLKKIGLSDCFSIIIGKDDVENAKPSSDGLVAIEEFFKEKNKKKYIFIGNNWKDKKAAADFKIDFLKV